MLVPESAMHPPVGRNSQPCLTLELEEDRKELFCTCLPPLPPSPASSIPSGENKELVNQLVAAECLLFPQHFGALLPVGSPGE